MSNKLILIVDDDEKIANLISFRLTHQGHKTLCAYRGRDALKLIQEKKPVLVLLDIRMPDMSGVDVLQELQKQSSMPQVIMISAHADVRMAVECMKFGAYDFVEKPIEFPELDAKVRHVLTQHHLEEEVSMLRRELGAKYQSKSLVGTGLGMRQVNRSIEIATKSDVHVLIEGESGTGKEMVARAIHFGSEQKNGPFIAVNCAAIPEHLLESELFGHEKGAFTGAVARKIGKFEQANGGTLFLDEIGDLPQTLQVKLLRVLQEREVERVGGGQLISISARIIAATNCNLKAEVKKGKFREDLFFRLNVFPVRIPPLRERMEDLDELIPYFVKKHAKNERKLVFTDAVWQKLRDYAWPGNVRELENFIQRLLLVKPKGNTVSESDLSLLEAMDRPGTAPDVTTEKLDRESAMQETEKKLLENALREAEGNVSKASRILRVSRDTFYRKMKKYAISR